MKKTIVLFVAAMILSLGLAGVAGADGLLGKRHAAVKVGMYEIDDINDDGPFVEVSGQVPIKAGKLDMDIFASLFKADGDFFEVTAFEAGANVTLPVDFKFKMYAGASLARVEVEYDVSVVGLPGINAGTVKETQPNAWAGMEMGFGEGLALNARAGLMDMSDLFISGEVIYAMGSKVSLLGGLEINISESDMKAHVGVAIGF